MGAEVLQLAALFELSGAGAAELNPGSDVCGGGRAP